MHLEDGKSLREKHIQQSSLVNSFMSISSHLSRLDTYGKKISTLALVSFGVGFQYINDLFMYSMDKAKCKDIEDKDMWLNAKKRIYGDKLKDDTSLLKTLKRQEKAKSKSEAE